MEKDIYIAGSYGLTINGENEIMLSISGDVSEPDEPKIIYDGGPHAIFYRKKGQTVILDYIDEQARETLVNSKAVLIAEYEVKEGGGEEVKNEVEQEPDLIRAYDVPVRTLDVLPFSDIINELPSEEEIDEILKDS